MKTPLIRTAVLSLVVVCAMAMTVGAKGCGGALHQASIEADAIGSSLSTAATLNHELVAAGTESAGEGSRVASLIYQASLANDAFIAQVKTAESSQGQSATAQIWDALDRLDASLRTLQTDGVLHLKSPAAQARFGDVIAAMQASLAVLKGLEGTAKPAAPAVPAPAPGGGLAAAAALALTGEEIEQLIVIASPVLGAGVSLVSKLVAMKSESDAALLADAASQDAAAEKQAESDTK